MKKINIRIIAIFIALLTFFTTFSLGAYSDVTMTVVEEPICTIDFGTNSKFEKKLYSKDLSNKEVTIQLKVTNNEAELKPTGEIMLVIDNSKSMLDAVGSKTREDLVIDSAKTLITNLLEDNTKLKIGAVSFSTNSDVSKEGTIEDATLISNLTNDSSALISAVSNIEYNGPRTDLDSGLKLAKQYFTDSTDNAHKYIIVLTDGVPNVAVNYDGTYYSDDVISKTKSELQSIKSVAENVIVMLTGISNGEATATLSTKTYNEIITEIFGTETNPTVGKFYYVTDDKIENTIKTSIYNDLKPVSQSVKDIKIIDYFPKEIIDNFDFSYVKNADIGNISAKVDTTNNSITWTIPELKSGETATVQYKLKLKNNYDSNIIDKVLDTNEKVDLSYTDPSGDTKTKTSDVTPKLKLTEPKPVVYPKAGKTAFTVSISILLALSIALGIKYFKIMK